MKIRGSKILFEKVSRDAPTYIRSCMFSHLNAFHTWIISWFLTESPDRISLIDSDKMIKLPGSRLIL